MHSSSRDCKDRFCKMCFERVGDVDEVCLQCAMCAALSMVLVQSRWVWLQFGSLGAYMPIKKAVGSIS